MTPLPNHTSKLVSMQAGTLDVLVIGGGIVGAGVARDAAMRGLRVGLVERYDFAFGTSSRSSRLLHGGLRYLAQGRIGLVRQASVEKKVLHKIAPHLAQPLAFIFPTYTDNRQWVLWQLKMGVKVYDLLCGGENFAPSAWLSRQEVGEKVAGLVQSGLKGAVRYYDALTNDARLTLDTLRSAGAAGAVMMNYCRFVRAQPDGGCWQCELQDLESDQTIQVRSQAVVNATGPWSQEIPRSRVKLRLTKGVHLVLERTRLPVPDAVVMTDGARILFAIPWAERVILGTTDTDYRESPGDLHADSTDVDYLLGTANRFFPAANLTCRDIVSSWAGLRPLVAAPSGGPSDVSRAHEITNPEPYWWDITGGKLTTYRLIAEEAVDVLARALQRGGKAKTVTPCDTASRPLLPATETQGFSSLVPPQLSKGVVAHYCHREWARHLEDVMIRRAGWHYYAPDRGDIAEQVSLWMAEELKWAPEIRERELENYLHQQCRALETVGCSKT